MVIYLGRQESSTIEVCHFGCFLCDCVERNWKGIAFCK